MDIVLTYIHHNCFCLRAEGRVLVFDYPTAEHRSPGARDAVRRAVAGHRAVVLFSHSHADHCSPDVALAVRDATEVRYVLSYDVPEMVPQLDPEAGLAGAVVVEPGDVPGGGSVGEAVRVDEDLSVRALESNDLGVAFLIDLGRLRVYFGGDLAAWVWPEMEPQAAEFTRGFFARSLEAVRDFAPHVAFTDCDYRLPGWAGFEEFATSVRPQVLVPTHDFGMPDVVREYAGTIQVPNVGVVTYERTGDETRVTITP